MKKITARLIGKMIGKTSREVNSLLAENGYLVGKPGEWSLTEKGRQYGEFVGKENGYGGWAARSWGYILWDTAVAYLIGDPDSYLARINKVRRDFNMDPLNFDEFK